MRRKSVCVCVCLVEHHKINIYYSHSRTAGGILWQNPFVVVKIP